MEGGSELQSMTPDPVDPVDPLDPLMVSKDPLDPVDPLMVSKLSVLVVFYST